jgi:hypothetical protein
VRAARRARAYRVANPKAIKRARAKFRDKMQLVEARAASARLDRAVKILFELT